MRVLIVTCGLPFPPDSGTRIRDFNLIRELSRSVTVSVYSLLTEKLPDDLGELRQLCESVQTFRPASTTRTRLALLSKWRPGRPLATLPFYSGALAAAIRSKVESRSVDLVQIEHSFLACYRDAIPDGFACGTLLSFHNVGSQQYRRMLQIRSGGLAYAGFLLKAAIMRGWESRVAQHFDRSLVVSSLEARLLRQTEGSHAPVVIENGVDCERFHVLPEQAGGVTLLFVGVLSYPPNTDGILWFVDQVWPIVRQQYPGARLTIVGLSPPPEILGLATRQNIVVRGWVQDLEPFYAASSVAIVPLRAGGGTRLKVLEAMAFGRPVVSTSIGCEGLDVVAGEHLVVADTSRAFAAGVIRLLGDRALRLGISASARELVETRYSWKTIAAKLVQVYQELHHEMHPESHHEVRRELHQERAPA